MKTMNKKAIMTLSALMVLIFHYWSNVTTFRLQETFIKSICYLGVDMFFFMSAFSIGSRPIKDAKKFWISRFQFVYLKFVFWALVALIVNKWALPKFLLTVFGIDLFKNGGGSFLWFLPAIMFFYLFLFIYQKLEKRFIWQAPLAVAVIWITVALLCSRYMTRPAMAIVWCRLPILLLGYYAAKLGSIPKIKNLAPWKFRLFSLILGLVLLVAFHPVTYQYGFKTQLQTPIFNLFYVVCIPTALALILLAGMIPENPVTNVLGSVTLEVYAVQMIYGTRFVKYWMKVAKNIWPKMSWKNMLFINLVTFAEIILIALVVGLLYNEVICKKLLPLISKKIKKN